MAVVYGLFSVVLVIIWILLWSLLSDTQVSLDTSQSHFRQRLLQTARDNLGIPLILAYILAVVMCLGAGLSLALRGRHYVSSIVRTRTLPRASWKRSLRKVASPTFIAKSLLFIGLLILVLPAVFISLVSADFYFYGDTISFLTYSWMFIVLLGIITLLLFPLFTFFLMLSVIVKLIRSRALPSTAFINLRGSNRYELFETLLYATVLFLIFYVTLLIVLYLGQWLFQLLSSVSEDIRSASRADELFIPLIALGTIINGILTYYLMFQKGGQAFKIDYFARGNWKVFLEGLFKGWSSPFTGRGLLWGLGVAYVFAIITAFLLTWLYPPPLPKVALAEKGENNSSVIELEKAWQKSRQSGDAPSFPVTTGCLLAHSEGHWYLFSETESDLMVVRDREQNLLMIPLDEASLEKPCNRASRY